MYSLQPIRSQEDYKASLKQIRSKDSEFPTYRAIFMSGHDALMLGLLLLPGLALSIAIMGTFAAGG